jgi:hypothetical protein
MTNKNKKYRDRHADERLIVYYLRRHKANLQRILGKVQ